MKDLTTSNIQRQNILNNKYALQRIQEYVGLEGMLFEGEFRFTKAMVADFFQVDISTLDRYLTAHETELKHNGYILSKGKQLKEFKLQFGHVINVPTKTIETELFAELRALSKMYFYQRYFRAVTQTHRRSPSTITRCYVEMRTAARH